MSREGGAVSSCPDTFGKGIDVRVDVMHTRDMNTTQTTTQAVAIDGTIYTHTGGDVAMPEFRNEKGTPFVGMRNWAVEGEFHMVPLTKHGKIRGQFQWVA